MPSKVVTAAIVSELLAKAASTLIFVSPESNPASATASPVCDNVQCDRLVLNIIVACCRLSVLPSTNQVSKKVQLTRPTATAFSHGPLSSRIEGPNVTPSPRRRCAALVVVFIHPRSRGSPEVRCVRQGCHHKEPSVSRRRLPRCRPSSPRSNPSVAWRAVVAMVLRQKFPFGSFAFSSLASGATPRFGGLVGEPSSPSLGSPTRRPSSNSTIYAKDEDEVTDDDIGDVTS